MNAELRDWEPFGIPEQAYPEADGDGVRVVNLAPGKSGNPPKDRAATWLRNAMIALGLLALAAAVVSFEAQYRMVFAAKGVKIIAGLEAGIPDVSAVVFASLGIALALQGKRALRARVLNVAAVATSVGMNYLAAVGGTWRDAAIWVMPSVAYAVASDTAIGVIRAYVIARQRQLQQDLADDEVTPLAILGGLFLWVLRLGLAPRSTLTGFRAWVVEEVKVAPGRQAQIINEERKALPPPNDDRRGDKPDRRKPKSGKGTRGGRAGSKTSQFLALVSAEHGELASIDPAKVSRICSELAPQVQLNPGSARSFLRPKVLAARAEAQS